MLRGRHLPVTSVCSDESLCCQKLNVTGGTSFPLKVFHKKIPKQQREENSSLQFVLHLFLSEPHVTFS